MSGWHQQVSVYEGEDELALREKFARLRAQHRNLTDYEIAAEVFKGLHEATARAGAASLTWPRDPGILSRVEELRRTGFVEAANEDAVKNEIQTELFALARNQELDAKDRLKAYELLLDANGLRQKSQTNVNVAVVNRVMKVTDHGDDAAWEARLANQQRELVNVSPSH